MSKKYIASYDPARYRYLGPDAPEPDVDSYTPTTWTATPTVIVFSGEGFSQAMPAYVGRVLVPVNIIDDTTMTLLTPAGVATADIYLHFAQGTVSLPVGGAAPAPVVVSLYDDLGDTDGGGRVQIVTGTNFVFGALIVVDGVTQTTSYFGPTEVRCTMPAHAPGVISVQVQNPDLQISNTANYEYWAPNDCASATLNLWYRGDSGYMTAAGGGPISNGANIEEWRDYAGGYYQIQTNGANQPTWVLSDAAFGGQPVVRDNASDWFFDGAGGYTIDKPITLLWLGQFVLNSHSAFSIDSPASSYNLLWSRAIGHEFFSALGTELTTPGTPNTGTVDAVLITDIGGASPSSNIYRNNFTTPDASAASNRWVDANDFNIGKISAGVNSMRGACAEIVIYDGVISLADRIRLRKYLNQRYDLVLT